MAANSTLTPPAIIKPKPEIVVETNSAMPMTRLMLSRSPRPQYWLMSTLEPLCRPKTTSWMMKTGTFATVTADI